MSLAAGRWRVPPRKDARRSALRVVAALVLAFGLTLGREAAAEVFSHDALLDQGFQALQAQRPADALLLFKRARFMSVSARAVGAMGLAEEQLGHWIDAEQNLSQALSFTQDPWVRAEKETLSRALERVQSHIGELRVVGGPPGTIVMIGDRSLARLPMLKPVRLAAGKLHLVLAPPVGFAPVATDVDLLPGPPTEVSLSCPKTK